MCTDIPGTPAAPAASDAAVYDALARGLARLAPPDLGGFDPPVVELAVVRAFTPTGPDPDWFAGLRRRVAALSDGTTALEVADRDLFPLVVKDPSAAYVRVVGPSRSRLAVIGPFTPCVQYIDPGGEQS